MGGLPSNLPAGESMVSNAVAGDDMNAEVGNRSRYTVYVVHNTNSCIREQTFGSMENV